MRKSLPPFRFFGGVVLGAAHVATALGVPRRRSAMTEIRIPNSQRPGSGLPSRKLNQCAVSWCPADPLRSTDPCETIGTPLLTADAVMNEEKPRGVILLFHGR
jgi:hypothetical protein